MNGGRCDCNGVCSYKERRYVNRGGLCPDCTPGEPGALAPDPRVRMALDQ